MAQDTKARPGLDALAGAAREAARKGPPPVHLWNPPFCGDLDMRIAADGTWFYLGTPIGRPALVKLFASVLKREDDKYFLVTPVEKCGLVVEDAPFLAVELAVERGRHVEGQLRAGAAEEVLAQFADRRRHVHHRRSCRLLAGAIAKNSPADATPNMRSPPTSRSSPSSTRS